MSDTQDKQTWTEAVIQCISDKAERERLIRFYDYDELVKACLSLGTLALSAKVESARNRELNKRIAALEAALRGVRGLLDDGLWESADRREDVRDWVEVVDALLHDKEKT